MNKPNFGALKSNAASLSERLQSKLREDNSGGYQEDTRYWKCSRDKAGNGYAVIRFLPPSPNPECPNGIEDTFYVRIYSHAFQGRGGWYIENSRTTINEEDPVGEYNSQLWNSGSDALKEQARKQKRRTHFVSNILVIDDPVNPANNGKVFLFKYGKKIFEMINDKMNSTYPGDVKFNPFDFWEGANFKLKIREVDRFPNYDKCEFDKQTKLFEDDAKLEVVWNQQYPLLPLIAPSEFKSYDALAKRMNKVLGLSSGHADNPPLVADSPAPATQSASDDDTTPPWENTKASAAKSQPTGGVASGGGGGSAAPDEEDEIEFFRRINRERK